MRRTAPLALRLTAPALVVGALALAAGPASAHPDIALEPTLPTDVTYSATDNVEFLGRFPEHTGTAGGALSPDRKRFFVTDPRGVHTYDVTDPANPRLTGSLRLFQTELGAALAQEDPDTNGRILLVDGAATPAGPAELHVVDVSGATPAVLSTVDVTDHTWTCISGRNAQRKADRCAYAYGRTGHIVDLTDPAKPALLTSTWRQAVGYGARANTPYTHDLTELRPGLVMTAGSTALLLDTRDPRNPKRLAAIEQKGRFPSLGYHSVEWAKGGRAPYVVLGTEIAPAGTTNAAGSDCEGESSVIETWDARSIVKAVSAHFDRKVPAAKAFRGAAFRKVDAYDAGSRGLFLTGAAPAHVLYCAHWMELHPDFSGSGLMAVSYYDRGTRFVRADAKGSMSEVGWFTPAEGYSGSPQWVSQDVVYVMDYRRGLEVLRLKPGKASSVRHAEDRLAPHSTVGPLGRGTVASGGLGGRVQVGTVSGSPLTGTTGALLALAPLLLVAGVLTARRRSLALVRSGR